MNRLFRVRIDECMVAFSFNKQTYDETIEIINEAYHKMKITGNSDEETKAIYEEALETIERFKGD